MRFSYLILVVGVFLIILGTAVPQITLVEAQSSPLSTNQYFPSQISNNISYSIQLPEMQTFYGFPFQFSQIDFNHNYATINGQKYMVNTNVNVSNGVVTVNEWLNPPVSSGAIIFVFNFEAAYVLHYDGFTGANYLHSYTYTSGTFYFTKNTTNWLEVGFGATMLFIGIVLFIKQK